MSKRTNQHTLNNIASIINNKKVVMGTITFKPNSQVIARGIVLRGKSKPIKRFAIDVSSIFTGSGTIHEILTAPTPAEVRKANSKIIKAAKDKAASQRRKEIAERKKQKNQLTKQRQRDIAAKKKAREKAAKAKLAKRKPMSANKVTGLTQITDGNHRMKHQSGNASTVLGTITTSK